MPGPILDPSKDTEPSEHRAELRYPDRGQVEHFGDRLVGLFNYLDAGLPTSFVIRAYGGDTKLIGWIVHIVLGLGRRCRRRQLRSR